MTTTATAADRPMAPLVRRADVPSSSSHSPDSPFDADFLFTASDMAILEDSVVRNDGVGIERENSHASVKSGVLLDSVNGASSRSTKTNIMSSDANAASTDRPMHDLSDAAVCPWSTPTLSFDGVDAVPANATVTEDDGMPERRRHRSDEHGMEMLPRKSSIEIVRPRSKELKSDKERRRYRAQHGGAKLRSEVHSMGSSHSTEINRDRSSSTTDGSLFKGKDGDPSKRRGKSIRSPTGVDDLRYRSTDSSDEESYTSESLEVDSSFLVDDGVNRIGCCAMFGGGGFNSILDVMDRIDDAINGRLEDDDEYSIDESFYNAYQESRHQDRRRKDNVSIVSQKIFRRHKHIDGKNEKKSIGHRLSRERQRMHSKRPSKQKRRSQRSQRSPHSRSSPSTKDDEVVRAYKVSLNTSAISEK